MSFLFYRTKKEGEGSTHQTPTSFSIAEMVEQKSNSKNKSPFVQLSE